MSLINNMLKDLEKRELTQPDMPYVGLLNTKKDTADYLPQIKIFIIAILIPLVFFSVFLLFFHQKSISALKPILTVEPATNTIPPGISIDDTNWLKPVTINGMTVQVKDNITEITFLLDHVALYELASDGTGNQLSVTIDHSQVLSELPAAANLNSALQKISTENIAGSTKFDFSLFPGATLKYVNLNDKDKNPELVVAIEYQATTTTTTTNPTHKNTVKTQAMESVLSQQYQLALSAAENGDYKSAINDLTYLIKLDPTFTDARVSLIALMLDQGNALSAKHIIDEGLNINPGYPPFIELKARILTTEGQVKEALALLQSASPPLIENPEYHAFIAALYERTNNNVMSVNLYRQVLAIDPHNGNWWFGLGVSLDKLNQSKEAINAYTKAMTEGHLNAESNIYLRNRLESLQEGVNDKA